MSKPDVQTEEKEVKEIDQPVETPAAPEVPEVTEEEGDAIVPGGEDELEKAETPAVSVKAPEFVPDYKFKAYRKEYEIPEEYRKDVKLTKDNQENWKKVFAGWKSTEEMKTERDSFESELKKVKPEFDRTRFENDSLKRAGKEGNVESILEKTGLKPEALAAYFVRLHELQQMSPEQRAWQESQSAQGRRAEALEYQNNQLLESHKQIMFETHEREMEQALSDPSVSQFVGQYDTKRGQEGAFRQVMQEIGFNHFIKTGGDPRTMRGGEHLPVNQVKELALQWLGYNPQAQSNPYASAPPLASPPKAAAPAPMPNAGKGSARAPGKKMVSTLADIRNRYRELEAEGA